MGLSTLLAATQQDSFDDDHGLWRQFILDHLDLIARRSGKYALDATLVNQYRYDLNHFLKDHLKRRNDIGWIVLLLNNLKNDFEFSEPVTLIIPSDKLIGDLYHSYITITSNKF